jgi:hypothetical protein
MSADVMAITKWTISTLRKTGLGGAFLSKESPEHAGAFQQGIWSGG